MGEFRYIPPDEVAARYRATNPKAPPRQNRQQEQKNVEVVLSLGAVRYVHFGPRTFCCPPVPYRLGQRVLDLHTKILTHVRGVARTGNKKEMDAYYADADKMVRLLWSHIRPLGKFKRVLWRMGLMRNPFKAASEAELKAITDFFLQGRMTSSVRSISETEVTA